MIFPACFSFVLLLPINAVVYRNKDEATLEVERNFFIIHHRLDFLEELSCGASWEHPPIEHDWLSSHVQELTIFFGCDDRRCS